MSPQAWCILGAKQELGSSAKPGDGGYPLASSRAQLTRARAPAFTACFGAVFGHALKAIEKMCCRFLKTPGEIIHEKSSKLEQLENEDHEDLKEDPLEVSL